MTPVEPRTGDWMLTYTGRAFWPMDPRPEDVDPADIAHSLSLLCRYNGHVSRFYSVAEHCVLMSRAVAPEHALWALLHDATEAYVGDMIRPLKRSMPDYRAAEDRVMVAIGERFGLIPPPDDWQVGRLADWEVALLSTMPAEVKDADNRILLTERAVLLADSPKPWGGLEDLEPLPVHICMWKPAVAEQMYLDRLHELTAGAA